MCVRFVDCQHGPSPVLMEISSLHQPLYEPGWLFWLLESRGLEHHLNIHWNRVKGAMKLNWRCKENLGTIHSSFKVNYAIPQWQNLSGKQTWQRNCKVRCGILHVRDQPFKVYTSNKTSKISALTHSYNRMPQITQWNTVKCVILESLYRYS